MRKAFSRYPVALSVLFISLLTVSVVGLSAYFIDESTLKAWLNYFQLQSVTGVLLLAIIMILLLSIGMPRQLSAFSAGYCFGTVEGALLATGCATVACWITLTLARRFFSDVFSQKYPEKLNKISAFFATQTFIKAVIIRILPVGSNFLTNVLAGIAKSPVKPYVLGSGLGFIPQMMIFSMTGSGVKLAAYQQISSSVILLCVAALLGGYIYRKSNLSAL